jgi:hypothetical protein
MALTLVNNNYVGELIGQLATLLTIGANDFNHFHFMRTKNDKVRFAFLSVNTVIQSFSSLCDIVPQGGVNREITEVLLVKFVVTQELCKDVNFGSEFSNATEGYDEQTIINNQVATWGREEVDNFSEGLQGLRWSGDTTLPSTELLSEHDGVIKLIKAKGAFSAGNPKGYIKAPTVVIDATNVIQQIGIVVDSVKNSKIRKHKGFKIIVSGAIEGFLRTAIRNKALTVGLNTLPNVTNQDEIGQICDKAFFGAPVFVVDGLDYQDSLSAIDNSNIIMAGVFEDSVAGILKCGVGVVKEEETLTIREVSDGDKIRWRCFARQNTSIPPNVSQMAMNA